MHLKKPIFFFSLLASFFWGSLMTMGILKWFHAQKGPSHSGNSTLACSLDGSGDSEKPILKVDGHDFYYHDLDEGARGAYYDAQYEAYEKSMALLKEFAIRYHLTQKDAEKQKYFKETGSLPSLNELVPDENVPETVLRSFYEQNRNALPDHVSFEQIQGQIKRYLANETKQKRLQAEVSKLEKSKNLSVFLKEPVQPKVQLNFAQHYPFKGSADGQYEIIALTGSFCPVCRSIATEFKESPRRLKNVKVKSILLFSPEEDAPTYQLAKAAWCLAKNHPDFYFDFIDQTYALPIEAQSSSTGPNPILDAKNQALDVAKKSLSSDALQGLSDCLDSEEAEKALQAQRDEMEVKGIKALMPTFYSNGKRFYLKQGETLLSAFEQQIKG